MVQFGLCTRVSELSGRTAGPISTSSRRHHRGARGSHVFPRLLRLEQGNGDDYVPRLDQFHWPVPMYKSICERRTPSSVFLSTFVFTVLPPSSLSRSLGATMASSSSAGPSFRPSSIDITIDDRDLADAPTARMAALRRMEGSALDTGDSGSASSLDIPKLLNSERVRRRSELARMRPLDSPPALEPEAIELPVIAEHPGARVVFHKDAKGRDVDVEIAPSFPSSLAPSVVDPDDAASTAPALEEQPVDSRKVMRNFVTLCIAIFMNGWNDGTNGPLLPRIQQYYNVSVDEGWMSGWAAGDCVRVDRVRRLGSPWSRSSSSATPW